MPLALNIGYRPSRIEFFIKKFNHIKDYLDFVDIKSSFLTKRDTIASIARTLSSKNIKTFLNKGGFFNLNFDLSRGPNDLTVSQLPGVKTLFQDFIYNFNNTPQYFQDSCRNVIVPVVLDDESSFNSLYRISLSDFLKDISENSNEIFEKILMNYHFNRNNSGFEYYLHKMNSFEEDYEVQDRIPLFLNLTEWHQKLKQKQTLQMLRNLRDNGRKIELFQIADYDIINDQIQSNLTIGNGKISWRPFLSFFKNSNIVIASKDGISSLKRSMAHLGEISIKKQDRTDGNSVVTGFFFSRDKKSFFQSSPGTKMALKYLQNNKISVNSIIDLGCGNGRNSFYLSKNIGAKAHLIDIDRDLLNYVKIKFETFNVKSPRVDVVDLEYLDHSYFDSTYDVTLLSYVLQNIHPTNYFSLMDFCRLITKKLMIFEIYINLHVYPEGKVTKRGETMWYGFSRKEIFQLFESFFDVVGWDVKKGKMNPLMISIIGKPKDTVKNVESILKKYKNIPTIDYRSIRNSMPKTKISKRNKVKASNSMQKKSRIIEQSSSDQWKSLSSHFLSTGLNVKQINLLESKLEEIDSSFKKRAPESFGALLYLVARVNLIPIHLQEIVKTLGVRRKDIHRAMKIYQNKHDLAQSLPSLEVFFERYHAILNLNEIYEISPLELITEVKSNFNCNQLGSLPHISALAIAFHLFQSTGRISNPSQLAKMNYISPSSLKNKLKMLEGIQLIR